MAKRKIGIYIFELKVDEPVDKAFAQIREKSEIPNRAVAVPATAAIWNLCVP